MSTNWGIWTLKQFSLVSPLLRAWILNRVCSCVLRHLIGLADFQQSEGKFHHMGWDLQWSGLSSLSMSSAKSSTIGWYIMIIFIWTLPTYQSLNILHITTPLHEGDVPQLEQFETSNDCFLTDLISISFSQAYDSVIVTVVDIINQSMCPLIFICTNFTPHFSTFDV